MRRSANIVQFKVDQAARPTYLVLHFSKQLLFTDIVNPQRLADTSHKATLEGHNSQWNIVTLSLPEMINIENIMKFNKAYLMQQL